MKKTNVFAGLLLIFSLSTFAKQVDVNTARQIGQDFLSINNNRSILKRGTALQLIYTARSSATVTKSTGKTVTYFYVFNSGDAGYVIVAGDDIVHPILGYSDEDVFDPDNIPPNAAKWLEGYKSQIRYAINKGIQATQEIASEWENLKSGGMLTEKSTSSVSPLVQTKWNQSPYYNDLCPVDSAAGPQNGYHCVTGCPATAMAQIMKYWNYPATGSGFHSYNHPQYGTLAANFGGTTYNWTDMPAQLTGPNISVATLMYQCGVAVEMGYGPTSSGSYVIISKSPTPQQCSEYAYKTYFGYDAASIKGIERDDYTDVDWITLLKKELDEGRPVQYAGFGEGSGHTFVCDGYDNSEMFHMNWGWGGYADGYFLVNSLNPGEGGTGSGNGTFNQGQRAVIGIKPPAGNQTYNLNLYNYVTLSPSTVSYGQSFSVSTDIVNSGTNDFSGDYCAAIFDSQWNFIDFVETKNSWTLQSGYHYTNSITFSNSGLLTMLPGSYYIGIFYRPTDGDWKYILNNGNYSNFVPLTVYYANDMELNSSMALTPGTTFIYGQPASVNVNIVNNGNNTFYGTYSANLYDLEGNWIETINTYTESNGLPSGYNYQSPYLSLSTSSITADPGTYLMAILHKPDGGDWTLTGSSNFQNPVYVTIKSPDLTPDIYEDNDSIGTSYDLPVTFSADTATVTTQGSNCHTGTDFDLLQD